MGRLKYAIILRSFIGQRAAAPDWRSTASLGRLPTIIDLLYGFAIGNGLSDTIKQGMLNGTLLTWVILFIASIVAISEWLAYHIHVSPIPYKSVTRLLMDMTFPVMVYLILLAPSVFNAQHTAAYVPTVLWVYFGLAVVYMWLMRREGMERDSKLEKKIYLCFGITSVAGVICLVAFIWNKAFIPEAVIAMYIGADVIALTAIAIWCTYNLRCVADTMAPPIDPPLSTSEPSDGQASL